MVSQTISRPKSKKSGSRSALKQQSQQLFLNEVTFIDSDEFRSLLPTDPRLEASEQSRSSRSSSTKDHTGLAEPLACLGSALNDPLLGSDGEQREFRRMNYFKFAANRLRSAINPQRPSKRSLAEIERLLDQAASAKDRIVRANLRLVVANAGKYCSPRYGFEDLFSDGVLSLLEAVEKFDYRRGFRFSTYATHCIRRSFYRRIERQQQERRRFQPTDPAILHATPDREASDDDQLLADQVLVGKLLHRFHDCLTERERLIVEARCGLGPRTRTFTLVELSKELGICKERVRQVEHRAIEKLRTVAFELVGNSADCAEAPSS